MTRVFTTISAAVLAACAALAMSAGLAGAHSYQLGQIEIGHLWVKPTADAKAVAGVYGAVMNAGDTPVTLVKVTSPAASRAGFCVDGDGGPKWQDEVKFERKLVIAFAEWREHICLSGLKQPLKQGGTVPLTLDFGAAGKIDVEAMVENAPSD